MKFPGNRALAVWIFGLSIIVRILLYVALDRKDVITRGETDHVAATLAERGEFADPYLAPTGPTAHLAPGFPLFLAAVYAAVPGEEGRQYAETILGTLFVSLVFALLPAFSLAVLGDRLVGVIAGFIGALNPAAFLSETDGREGPISSLLFLFGCWLTTRIGRRSSLGVWALYGAYWAFVLLFQPAYLVPLGAMAVIWMWNARGDAVKPLLAAGLAACLVLTPWTIRNWLVFHEFVVFRDNLGMELRMSFYDGAIVPFPTETHPNHPFGNEEERKELRRVGEVAYNQELKAAAVDWIKRNPAETLSLVARRTVAFWFPYYRSKSIFLPASLVSLLAGIGLFLMFRRGHPSAIWMAAVVLTYPVLYYLIQVALRYRYPIESALYLCAGYAIAQVLRRYWRSLALA